MWDRNSTVLIVVRRRIRQSTERPRPRQPARCRRDCSWATTRDPENRPPPRAALGRRGCFPIPQAPQPNPFLLPESERTLPHSGNNCATTISFAPKNLHENRVLCSLGNAGVTKEAASRIQWSSGSERQQRGVAPAAAFKLTLQPVPRRLSTRSGCVAALPREIRHLQLGWRVEACV